MLTTVTGLRINNKNAVRAEIERQQNKLNWHMEHDLASIPAVADYISVRVET